MAEHQNLWVNTACRITNPLPTSLRSNRARGYETCMSDNDICDSLGDFDGVFGNGNGRRGDLPLPMCDLDRFDLPTIAHISFFQVLAKLITDHTNSREVLYPDKADFLQFGREDRQVPEGIVSANTSENVQASWKPTK
ncbi:uncharacterized protein N7473_011862 [Penicillium subrubescens]|uniref:uncharacterized protein n=1 Tax=Penicillium subrubescens TaxID=1316194 RepID=UPI0025453C32|nr:uncharacterized protein N7473_011862 [Penicillium subrubescens]KAJ5880809.1 hypothetical protein N7473_011862 [Penicillium subrubescens]